MQRRFLLQILLLAQHVSGTTMPIIRSSRVLYSGCCISCCKNVKINFVSFCEISVLSLKCRVLSRFVIRCVECCGGRVWVFLVWFFCSVKLGLWVRYPVCRVWLYDCGRDG